MGELTGPSTHGRYPPKAERIAREFHETYERLAPQYGYETREASRRPWANVPAQNRDLMVEVVIDLLFRGVIRG